MYDDFAVLGPEQYPEVNKEYQINMRKICANSLLSTYEESLNSKINTLKKHINNLLTCTKNKDVQNIVGQVIEKLKVQEEKINSIFRNGITIESELEPNTKIFCNNLKLSLQITTEIIQTLVAAKDDETTSSEAKLELTNIINSFIEINNNLVSLFGECQYRRFKLN